MSRTVIIGGGIIGLCCAYELRRRGEEVVVLEREQPGAGASSGNAGLIVPSFSGPVPGPGVAAALFRSMLRPDSPLYLNPRALPQTAGWLRSFRRHCNPLAYDAGFAAIAHLAAQTMTLFDTLSAEGVAFEMRRDGLLFAYLNEANMGHMLDDLDRLQAHGYRRPAILTGSDLRDLEPGLSDRVRAGFFLPQERHIQPETLVAGVLARLRTLGGQVRAGMVVTGIQRRAHAIVSVVTPSGPIEGDRFLIAAGAWSGVVARLCGFHLPMQAVKGYSVTVSAPVRRFRRPLYLGDTKLIASPFQHSTRVAGWLEFSGINPAVDAGRLRAMRRAAGAYLRGWESGGGERQRAGLRPMAPDGLPVIGPVPGYDNLFVATGHGVLGITLAPATARAVADFLTGGSPGMDLQPFAPARFLKF